MPPFPRSSLAHRTGDPSIFARPSTERNHHPCPILTIHCWIEHVVVSDLIFQGVNAARRSRYKSLKLFLSPPRPGRNKRAMTPFSAKTTMLGKPKRRRFNPLRSTPVRPKRVKNKSLPCISGMCGGIVCLKGGKTARSWLLRVRRLFISPPSVPGSLWTSSSASRCLCAPRGASQH